MLIKAAGLTERQLSDIKKLENACCHLEKLTMKLNWEMLRTRSMKEINDFLYYQDDQLVGFLGLYGFGRKEIELTGMVHPDYRRKGIFKELFREAKNECSKRQVGKILIISERCSQEGLKFCRTTGACYEFSEYHMQFNKSRVPSYDDRGIKLRIAEKNDKEFLGHMDNVCFGIEEPREDIADPLSDTLRTQYIIELDSQPIGKIGIMKESGSYIFGFGISPEYRGQGFGRAALSLTLEALLWFNALPVKLEVASENDKALSLYKSCGFEEVTIYDYYALSLNQP